MISSFGRSQDCNAAFFGRRPQYNAPYFGQHPHYIAPYFGRRPHYNALFFCRCHIGKHNVDAGQKVAHNFEGCAVFIGLEEDDVEQLQVNGV